MYQDLEHTCVVHQLIQEARENKGGLVVLWLNFLWLHTQQAS